LINSSKPPHSTGYQLGDSLMLRRTIALSAFGVAAVLFGASQTDAQPGKGKGGGDDIQRLERDLERLLEQVDRTKADLARIKEAMQSKKDAGGPKGKKGFDGFKGFKGKGFGPKGFGPKGFEGKDQKLDPETVKERYEFYKKLYD